MSAYKGGKTEVAISLSVDVSCAIDIVSPENPSPVLLIFVEIDDQAVEPVVSVPLDSLSICSIGDYGDELSDDDLRNAVIESLERLILNIKQGVMT